VTHVSLTDVAGYLPKNRVGVEFFTDYPGAQAQPDRGPMFQPPAYRHHAAPGESAVDMVERAVQPLIERHGAAAIRDVDVLLVHTQLPDIPIVGCGTEVVRRLGCRPEWLIDVANAGCAAFIYMIKLAGQILRTTDARTALICNVQNAAGQMFTQSEVRKLPQAAIPGDGCGVGYLTTSAESPVLAVECRHVGEYAGEMTVALDDGRKYWEPGRSQMRVGFTDRNVAEVVARGNRLVPEAVTRVCDRLGMATSQIDVLVTNQPNRLFLQNWRESLELPPERHPDTFDDCGNLFGAAIPLTLDRAIGDGRVPDGATVVLGGFAHAGDFAGAAAIRWRAGGRHRPC
jgi:3-oxoacyl-[acyl-carrier-protein] synthase III